MATAAPTRPPFWRDVRVLRILGQVLFVVIVALVLREIWQNLQLNYRRQGLDTNWDFLDSRAGFSIGEHVLDYSPNNSYLRAYIVGLTNTIFMVTIPGIILASIIGLIVGVGRLSHNWIVRKLSQVYVESLRNIPVLIVIIIMFVGFFLSLPRIEESIHIPGIAYISNRAFSITYLQPQSSFGIWLIFVGLGIAGWYFIRRRRTVLEEATGDPKYPNTLGLLTFLAILIAGAFVVGGPLELHVPRVNERGFGYENGLTGTVALGAVVTGLVLYTSAFIAEIIRGSIQAVSKGQKEAAEALGLKPRQQLRFVVLPQAFRIALPPINNQYLNLMKNSTLAIAVGFFDLGNISKTMINQSGRSFQVLMLVLFTYLALSLVISTLMNIVNRAVVARGEHHA
jgi:general L-amino acid transport system permease protein